MGRKSDLPALHFLAPALDALEHLTWRPAVDVYRTRDGWLLKFELAGVCPQDLEVGVQGRCIVLRGCRRDSVCTEGHRPHSMEIAYCEFERSVELPHALDRVRVSQEYRDGLLIVRVAVEEAP